MIALLLGKLRSCYLGWRQEGLGAYDLARLASNPSNSALAKWKERGAKAPSIHPLSRQWLFSLIIILITKSNHREDRRLPASRESLIWPEGNGRGAKKTPPSLWTVGVCSSPLSRAVIGKKRAVAQGTNGLVWSGVCLSGFYVQYAQNESAKQHPAHSLSLPTRAESFQLTW